MLRYVRQVFAARPGVNCSQSKLCALPRPVITKDFRVAVNASTSPSSLPRFGILGCTIEVINAL